jgi:methylenetetrahydrofolate reductase (NADPH)
VNNDFHKTHDIFDLFKDLVVKDIDVTQSAINGDTVDESAKGSIPNGAA